MGNPNEDELMAHLDELEKGTLRKGGDALQNAPHDGGFATEGTNIQSKAAKKMVKALMKGGMSEKRAKRMVKATMHSASSSSSSSVHKGEGDEAGDDDSSSDDESSAMSSDDDSSSMASDDDSSSAGGPPMMKKGKINKSLGAAALANSTESKKQREGTIRKALTDENLDAGIDAVPILDKLISTLDAGNKITKSDLSSLKKSFVRGIENQEAFNGKVAKALSIIAGAVIDTRTICKSIADQPVQRSNAPTLRKSDLHQPQFDTGTNGFDGTGEQSLLVTNQIPMLRIQEALVDMCMKGGAGAPDFMEVTKFENSKGNLNVLPPHVVKQLEQRLCAAS